MRHVALAHVLLGGREPERGVAAGELSVGADRDHRLEEQARLLLHRHLGQQQVHTLVDGERRVEPGAGADVGEGRGG